MYSLEKIKLGVKFGDNSLCGKDFEQRKESSFCSGIVCLFEYQWIAWQPDVMGIKEFFMLKAINLLSVYFTLMLIFMNSCTFFNKDLKDQYKHFINSMNMDKKAVEIINSGDNFSVITEEEKKSIIFFTKNAVKESKKTSKNLLELLHPELYGNYQIFIESLNLRLKCFKEADFSYEIQSKILHNKWISWISYSKDDFNLEKLATSNNNYTHKLLLSILLGMTLSQKVYVYNYLKN
jgi:hypothetical protein